MSNKKIKKYPNGGQKAGQWFQNYGNALADTALSTVGLDNVIQDSKYQGYGANAFKGIANTVGGIEKTALPIVANVALPGSGAFVSAGQKAIGNFNPQDPNADPNSQRQKGLGAGIGAAGAAGYKMFSNLPNTGMTPDQLASQFPFGGNTGSVPQLEKQEVFQTPQGQVGQVNAPTHAGGGVNMPNLPNNTRIFSDRLKGQSGKTYAEEAAKFTTDKWQKILDKSTDTFSKNAAKRMLEITNSKLDKLFNEQETFKQANGLSDSGEEANETTPDNETNEFPLGGIVPTKSDSLNLYNNARELNSFYSNHPEYRLDNSQKINPAVFNSDQEQARLRFSPQRTVTENENVPMTYGQYYKPKDNNQYFQRENANSIINRNIPIGLYDKRITPQFEKNYTNTTDNGTLISGDKTSVPQYDPLAVKPWDMMSPSEQSRRIAKYGYSGTPLKQGQQPAQTTQQPTAPVNTNTYLGSTIQNGVPQPINSTIQAQPNMDYSLDLTSRMPVVQPQPKYQQGQSNMGVGNLNMLDQQGNQIKKPGAVVVPAEWQFPGGAQQFYAQKGIDKYGNPLPTTTTKTPAPPAYIPKAFGGTINKFYDGGEYVRNPDYTPFNLDPNNGMSQFTVPDMSTEATDIPNQFVGENFGPDHNSGPIQRNNGSNFSMDFTPQINPNANVGLPEPGSKESKTPLWDKIKEKYAGTNPAFAMASAGNFLGSAYDIYRGAKGGDAVNYDRVNPNLVDYTQSRDLTRRNLNTSFRDTRKAIQEGTNGNAGNYLANVANAAANRDTNIRDNNTTSIETQQNNNATIKNTAASTNAQIQMTEANARQQEKDIASNTLSTGLYNFGAAANQLGVDKQIKAYEPIVQQLISTGDYSYYDDPKTGKKRVGIKHNGSGKVTYFQTVKTN